MHLLLGNQLLKGRKLTRQGCCQIEIQGCFSKILSYNKRPGYHDDIEFSFMSLKAAE